MDQTTEAKRIACVRRYIGQGAPNEQGAAGRAAPWTGSSIENAMATAGERPVQCARQIGQDKVPAAVHERAGVGWRATNTRAGFCGAMPP